MVELRYKATWLQASFKKDFIKALTYLADKCEVDEHTFSTHVYWNAIKTAQREATVPIQIFMSKWVCGQTATGVVMVKRKQCISSECPR